MFLHARSGKRPVQLGSFPLEILSRDASLITPESDRPPVAKPAAQIAGDPIGRSLDKYRDIYAKLIAVPGVDWLAFESTCRALAGTAGGVWR
jgi:hypothetical protein